MFKKKLFSKTVTEDKADENKSGTKQGKKKKITSSLGLKPKDEKGIRGLYNRTIGSMDKVTQVYTYIGLAIVLFTGALFIEATINKSQEDMYEMYTDTDLNFRIAIPHGWQAAKPEVENVKKAVFDETKGKVAFDMYEHSLGKEVVPIAILNADSDSKSFAEFATLSFRGSESEFGYLSDLVNIKDDVKSLLESSDNKEVEVYDVAETTISDTFTGVLVKARAIFELEEVEYYVWYEPAGANLLTITYGATGMKEKEMMKSLEFIIGGIIYDQPTIGMTEAEELKYLDLVEKQASQVEAEQFVGEEGNTSETTTDILPTLPTWTTEEKEDKK